MLLAINTDPDQPRTAWTVVHSELHREGGHLRCIYSTDPNQLGQELEVRTTAGRTAVLLTVPAAGFVIFE
jgi:hypothetical protein